MTALPETVDQGAMLRALDCDECRTVDRLSALSGIAKRGVVKAVGKLIARGLAERREVGCFVLTEAGALWRDSGRPITGGPWRPLSVKSRRPRRRTIRDRIWDAFRIRQKASTPEILELVGAESNAQADSVRKYIRLLVRAGYLREMPRRHAGTSVTSNGYKRFTLMADTGPEAPRRKGPSSVYDPNTDETKPLLPMARRAS